MMNWFQISSTIRLGIKNLMLHKLRSLLTMLGIVFGVCSVIAMLAIGEGASYEAQQAIKKLGSHNIILRSVKPPQALQQSTFVQSFVLDYGLRYKDASRIRDTVPGVRQVVPMRIIRDEVRFGSRVAQCQVIGTWPIYIDVVGLDIVRGRFITDIDELFNNNVCAITLGLAQYLFPYQDPIGQAIKIQSFYFRIIGIVREKSIPEQRTQVGPMEGEPLDANVYIPLSTSRSRFGETIIRRTAGSMQAENVELHQITIQMGSLEAVETASTQIKVLLNRFHTQPDYEVIVPLELLRQAQHTKRIFNIVLGSIAAISLLVGGIGIMNIMLATVTERTREIGIRRALGAKKRDIILQFLVETVVLSVGGGLVGVALGIIAPLIVSHFTNMRTIVTIWAILLAFGISGAVGIIFGIYPARAAANLDPIEALRHE